LRHLRRKGQIFRSQGFFQISTTCPACGGEGRVVVDPCKECSGRGKIRLDRKINLKIPPASIQGLSSGSRAKGKQGKTADPQGIFLS